MSSDPGSGAGATVVVTVPAEDLLDAVSAGLERAGRGASVAVVSSPRPAHAVAILTEIGARGARGIPVLELRARADGVPELTPGIVILLTDPSLRDLHVAVPAFSDDDTRRALWEQLRAERIEERHQLVEVDGRTALGPDPDLPQIAAAAAGILAGRMAAADRAWARPRP